MSTVRNWLIDLSTALKAMGYPPCPAAVKRMHKKFELLLLRETPRKAKLLTDKQLQILLRVKDPRHAVTLALMLPSGSRFGDVARILPSDFRTINSRTGVATLRIFQAKNIRKRLHQRWLTQRIPSTLLPYLMKRMDEAKNKNEPLISTTYAEFLHFLKTTLKDPEVATYSVRRTVFDKLRQQVKTIEEMVLVTMHFRKEMLRWYLEAPLPDESEVQLKATSWHVQSL